MWPNPASAGQIQDLASAGWIWPHRASMGLFSENVISRNFFLRKIVFV